MSKKMSRRSFIHGSALAAAGAAAVACSPQATPAPEAPQAPTEAAAAATAVPAVEATAAPEEAPAEAAPAAASPYKESPMLAELVKAGQLPPIEQRLPENPYVVRPGSLISEKYLNLKVGTYGGVMKLAQESPSGDPHIFIGCNEYLLQSPDCFDFDTRIEGGVLEGWEANEDNTVFMFKLRKGLKWSDGEPVTMDDVRFAWEGRASKRGDHAPLSELPAGGL